MHFQSATPCVRHDHALSARGGDFIAWSLSLTGLVNAYWPDWHTSSRKLTKWCLTDNLAQFENCHHSHRRKLFLFLHDGPHSFINKNYSFLLIHCLFVFRFLFHFVNLFLTGCDWQEPFFRNQGSTSGDAPPWVPDQARNHWLGILSSG